MNTHALVSESGEPQINEAILKQLLAEINKKLTRDHIPFSLTVEGFLPFLELKNGNFVLNEDGVGHFLTAFENVLDGQSNRMHESIEAKEHALKILREEIATLSSKTKKENRRMLEKKRDRLKPIHSAEESEEYTKARQQYEAIMVDYRERCGLETDLSMQEKEPARLKAEKAKFDQSKRQKIDELETALRSLHIGCLQSAVIPSNVAETSKTRKFPWFPVTAAAVVVILGTIGWSHYTQKKNRDRALQAINMVVPEGMKMISAINHALDYVRLTGDADGFVNQLNSSICVGFGLKKTDFSIDYRGGKYFYVDKDDTKASDDPMLATEKDVKDAQMLYKNSSPFMRVKATLLSHIETIGIGRSIRAILLDSTAQLARTGNIQQLVSKLHYFFRDNLHLDPTKFNIAYHSGGVFYSDNSNKNDIFRFMLIGSDEIQIAMEKFQRDHTGSATSPTFTLGADGSIQTEGNSKKTTGNNLTIGLPRTQVVENQNGATETHQIQVIPETTTQTQ